MAPRNYRSRLAQRRRSLGYTQEGLAERLGVDPATVRRWEIGIQQPQPWNRPKLGRLLRVGVDELDQMIRSASSQPDDRSIVQAQLAATAYAHVSAYIARRNPEAPSAIAGSMLPDGHPGDRTSYLTIDDLQALLDEVRRLGEDGALF